MPNTLTLTVNGTRFEDWTSFRLDRGIDRCVTDFEISVTERAIGSIPWQLMPFVPCTLALNGQLALTGYIDSYNPAVQPKGHSVTIRGRSKTADLVDCSADIRGGQYSGYTLDAICRAVCAPFGIGVIVTSGTDMGEAFDDVQLYRHETCFDFLERLCRLRGVLASDDPTGNFVLTTAGAQRAEGALRENDNIQSCSASLSGARRFSIYKITGQQQVDDDTEGTDATEVEAEATDPGVPRYRPHVVPGECALDPATAQLRAKWQAKYNAARGTEATITVPDWQQTASGPLWKTNQVVGVHAPTFLKLDRDLLIVRTGFRLDRETGATTALQLGPQEGWTPDPGEVRVRKGTSGGTAGYWNDVTPLTATEQNRGAFK